MLKQTAFVFGFVILGLALFVAMEHSLSPVFQECVDEHEREEIAKSPSYKPAAFGSIVIGANVQCGGEFADRHGGGITALATLMIAAFTLILWITTIEQARLTKESVDIAKNALELLERAYLDVDIKHIKVGEQQLQYRIGRVVNVVYELRNAGRTVAIVTELHSEIRFSESKSRLPNPPRVDAWKLPRTLSIAPNVPFPQGNHEDIDQIQQDRLMASEPTLFAHFFLYIGYKDALPGTREPVVLTGVIAMRSKGRGVLESYAE
ncbi:MAG: hypothetical protein ACLP0B_24265 [Steroidobacteraceae bacterium]|jgi:hypothetical protein